MIRLSLAVFSLAAIALPVQAQFMRWQFQKVVSGPAAREHSAMAYDRARDQIVLFGGWDSTGSELADTWTYQGRTWTLQKPLQSPSLRAGHAMVYDEIRQEVLLYAGAKGRGGNTDTWAWNGKNWKLRATKAAGGPDTFPGMAYDRARQQTIMFGGWRAAVFNAGTYAWNGMAWMRLTPTRSPSARFGHTMAYDATRKQVVLFGGYELPSKTLADTWIWDGRNWNRQTPATSPSARLGHSMIFDEQRQRIVLFGGTAMGSSMGLYSDTWEWDGKTWTQIRFKSVPAARFGQSMAYSQRQWETMLFGGRVGGVVKQGDTWILSTYRAAAASFYGQGCGAAPGLRLAPATGSLPTLGDSFTAEIRGLPLTTAGGVISLGLSRTAFGPIKLPLDLTPLGMSGCRLYNSFEIQFAFSTSKGLGIFGLPVPYLGSIKGSKVYLQAFGADRAATKLGFVSSNGLELVFGYR